MLDTLNKYEKHYTKAKTHQKPLVFKTDFINIVLALLREEMGKNSRKKL